MNTSKTAVCQVSFVGGPLDGHEQIVSLSPQELDDLVLLPVGKILSLLYGNRVYEDLNSIALYELTRSYSASPSYRYLGPVFTCTS